MNSLWRHVKRNHLELYDTARDNGLEEICCGLHEEEFSTVANDTTNSILEFDETVSDVPAAHSSQASTDPSQVANHTEQNEQELEKYAARYLLGMKEKHRLTEVNLIALIISKLFWL